MTKRFVKVFRCRLCQELVTDTIRHVENTRAAARYDLSEHCYEAGEHIEHFCNDGSIGVAFVAGYKLEVNTDDLY